MLLNRRKFLGRTAAGTASIAIPALLIPKTAVAVDKNSCCSIKTGLDWKRRRFFRRRVEQLYSEEFATVRIPGSMTVACLWRSVVHPPGYNRASTIRIEKEVWFDQGRWHKRRCQRLGLDPEITELEALFVNFHLFNYVDYSKAHTPWSGCRTHDYREPYLDLREALYRGVAFADEALRSGPGWCRVGIYG